MSTHAYPGGLRPALPPTLQPMALALAAPRTDKRTAFIASGLIYLLIPAALMALDRMIPDIRPHVPPTTGGDVIFDPPTIPVVIGDPAQPSGRPEATAGSPAPEQITEARPQPPDNVDLESLIPSPVLPNGPIPSTRIGGGPGTTIGTPSPGGPAITGNPGPSTGQAFQISSEAVRILHQTVPAYPAVARATKQQGDVIVRMFIDTHGVPTSVQVEQGPPLLRMAAEQAARQWRFTPAQLNGQFVPATFLLTLKFRLQ